MHGGRSSGVDGGVDNRVSIKGCDKEHEQHEMLVKHFKVRKLNQYVYRSHIPRFNLKTVSPFKYLIDFCPTKQFVA